MAKKVAIGISQDAHGLRAFVRTQGRLRSKRFPPGALLAAKRWREDTKARAVLRLFPAPPRSGGSTLADDIARYLDAVQGMASITDRARDLRAWADAFGTRARSSITSVEIRTQLEAWKKERKLAASTLNHRRTALMHLFRVLDGKSATNPVADVPKYQEPKRAALIHSPADIAKALNGMRDSKSKRVLSVFAWTGWPYQQIRQLTPADLSRLDDGIARVTPRRKGAGAEGRWLPLLPPAIDALKALELPGDTQKLSRSTLHRDWTRACERAKITPCRPYDLRHAFGTLIAKTTADARAVSELLLHADPKQALRYTQAAGITRAEAAIALVTSRDWPGRKNPVILESRRAAEPKKRRKA
jgi:integrase